jgi:uncharacterized protein (DUF2336 family)
MTDVADTSSRLGDLIALAQEPSSEKRRELLREVTEVFFGPGADKSQVELDLFGAVLTQLTADMEQAVRVELSQRFAPSLRPPTGLIRMLAEDCAAVAEPVLAGSHALTEADLLELVRTKGQDHLRIISGRADVSEAVSDVIVERGDDDTLGTLLRNDGAKLSRGASETAVERAQANPALHEAVVSRASLPPDLLNEMYFVVEARLRQTILERNAHMDPALLENALQAGRTRLATADGALPPDYAEAQAYVSALREAGELTPQVLARFLRSGGRTQFLIALAQLADIDFHTARQIVDRRQIDALAVVCRAADMDRALFLTYAVILLGSEDNAIGKAQTYAGLYAELARDTASRTLRFWRMRRGVAEAA